MAKTWSEGLAVTSSAPQERPEPLPDGQCWYRARMGSDAVVYVLVELDSAQRATVLEVRLVGHGILAEHLREIPLSRIMGLIEGITGDQFKVQGKPPPLPQRTRGKDDSAEFARLLARHYRYWSDRTSSPAKAIAKAHGVPVATVHWWIREARRLGELPPGRQGRVG